MGFLKKFTALVKGTPDWHEKYNQDVGDLYEAFNDMESESGRSIIPCSAVYDSTNKIHVLTPLNSSQTIPASGMVPVTFIPDADFHAGDKLRFNGQDCNAAYSNTDLAVADGAFRAGIVTSATVQLSGTSGTAVLQGGAAAYAGNAGKLDGLAPEAYIQPQENLFINWNLKNPVNQQNKTNYTKSGYCIDMWIGGLASEATTGYSLSITPDGLVLLPLHFIQQTFEQVSWEGEIVTFALLMDGMLYTASWKWNKDAEYELIANFRGLLIRYSGKYKYIQLLNSATDNLILQAAKAEKGAIFTGWPVWNYALELLRCQRYFRSLAIHDLWGASQNAVNYIDFAIPGARGMRTTPAIINPGGFNLSKQGFTFEFVANGLSPRLRATKASHGITYPYLEALDNIYLDANL